MSAVVTDKTWRAKLHFDDGRIVEKLVSGDASVLIFQETRVGQALNSDSANIRVFRYTSMDGIRVGNFVEVDVQYLDSLEEDPR